MKPSLLSLLCASSLLVVACGGAVEPTSSGGQGPSTPNTPGTPSQPGQPAPSPQPNPPTPTPTPAPEGWASTANGCGNFTVYAPSTSGKKFVVVQADKQALGIANLGDTAQAYLGTKSAAALSMDVFARAPADPIYCNDVIVDPQTPTHWIATQGKATFTISALGRDGGYAVTVKLEGVIVRAPDGTTESIPDMTLANVNVGWLPG